MSSIWQCPREVGVSCANERSFVVNTVTLTKNSGPRLDILIFFRLFDLLHGAISYSGSICIGLSPNSKTSAIP